jgi:hypothetical protein
MRLPHVTGRIGPGGVAAAPAQVLRAVFTQVGRTLMAADEYRQRAAGGSASGPPAPPAAAGAELTMASALPVPDYDGLSMPSLRARLRYLNAGQLRDLVAYERAHAGRAGIVAMFERRIAKLDAQ